MTIIHKYRLKITSEQSILMPVSAKILCVCEDVAYVPLPCICAIVGTDEESAARKFYIYGTGQTMHRPDTEWFVDRYIGSVVLRKRALVLHVFRGED